MLKQRRGFFLLLNKLLRLNRSRVQYGSIYRCYTKSSRTPTLRLLVSKRNPRYYALIKYRYFLEQVQTYLVIRTSRRERFHEKNQLTFLATWRSFCLTFDPPPWPNLNFDTRNSKKKNTLITTKKDRTYSWRFARVKNNLIAYLFEF